MRVSVLLLLAGCAVAPPPEPELPGIPVLYEWSGHDFEGVEMTEAGVIEMLRHSGCCRLSRLEVSLVEGETLRIRNVFGIDLDVRPGASDDGQSVVLDCTLRCGARLVDVGARTIPMGGARLWRLSDGRLLILYVPGVTSSPH